MSVDIFGRSSLSRKSVVLKGPPGVGFSLTDSGNFDIECKRLCNIGGAVDLQDAVNLKVLKEYMNVIEVEQKKFQENIRKEFTELSDKINDCKIEQKKLQEELNKRFQDLSGTLKQGNQYVLDQMDKTFDFLAGELDKKFAQVRRENWI